MPSPSKNDEIRRIGRLLRALREKSGRSLAQMANASGISERAVRELEAGRTSPTLFTVSSITNVLGVTLDDLVAAARRSAPAPDYTPGDEKGANSTLLTRQLSNPRMRARMVWLDGGSETVLDSGSNAVFGHVLSGEVAVSLDGDATVLRPGDSFHAQAGVLGGWQGRTTGSRLLVVEALPDDAVRARDESRQEQP